MIFMILYLVAAVAQQPPSLCESVTDVVIVPRQQKRPNNFGSTNLTASGDALSIFTASGDACCFNFLLIASGDALVQFYI